MRKESVLPLWVPFVLCLVLATSVMGGHVAIADHHEGDRPHVVFVIHENEYEASRTLPEFARTELEEKLGWKCTYVQGEKAHDLPGLEALETADLLVVYVRRQVLPAEQLKYIRAYCESGKPVVGIRTASHAFAGREGMMNPDGVEWPEFDQDVLGGNYADHHGNNKDNPTVIWGSPTAKGHPILEGVTQAKHTTTSWLYKVLPLSDAAVPLMMGQVGDRVPVEPVAWTNISKYGSRVFYTSLGHPDDFTVASFRTLLSNSMQWALNGDDSDTTKEGTFDVSLRSRETVKRGSHQFSAVSTKATWQADKTAIIICDMWDNHHCISAARRTAEMAPHMNRVVSAARDNGAFIIHAPSDTMDFYQDTPQRKRAQDAPHAKAPVSFKSDWFSYNSEHEGPLPEKLDTEECSCDTPETCGGEGKRGGSGGEGWTRQIATIDIAPQDAITDMGQEVYNLLEDRDIENVVIMGVHTNACVLGRPFAIRQMTYAGKKMYLTRDLTDSFHRDPGNHFQGITKIVEHIEKYWCPTITSDQLAGGEPFRFEADPRETE